MPTPHVVPDPNATSSTWQIGTYNAVTDTWSQVLDLNDRVTWFVKSYDIPQPEKVVSRSGNPRTNGERITNERYKNRFITLTLLLRSTTTLAAIDTAIHSLESALSNTPFMLRLAEAQASQYSYAVVKSWVHSIPQDPLQRLAKVKTGITLVLECEPGLLGDKLYLDNLVVNPGFEAPSGPGVQAFVDTFASTNAYALQTGGAPTLSPSNTFVDVVNANGGANLLRYYRLGESSGTTAYDISGMAQPGTYTAAPTLGVAGGVSGDTDTAITLNGTTQYVDCPTTGLPTGNSAITLLLRFKFAANPAANQFLMTYGSGAGGAHNILALLIDSAGKLHAGVGTTDIISAGAVTTGAYHTAAVTWDGTTLTLYLDGASAGTATPGAQTIPTSGLKLRLGATADTSAASFFAGQIDEAMLWNANIGATAISNIHTAANTGATGTVSNAMSLPAAARVAFGSPGWGAINQWQVRFRWVSGLTADFFLHLTDVNNYLRCHVTGSAVALQHDIAGTITTLATSSVVLTHEAWYWVQITQFPTVPGNAPYVQATLFYDDNGAVGTQVAGGAVGPVATFDAVTALSGRPQLFASGAALVVGGNFSNTHAVSLFGPGGWSWAGINGAAGEASLAWEQNTANTYTGGPVTSYGAARIDLPPAGTVDGRLSTWDGNGGASGAAQYGIPTSQSHVLGLALAYKTTAGLSATSKLMIIVKEIDANGVTLVTAGPTIITGVAQTTWASYSGTYTVANASTASVRLQLQVVETTAGASANQTVWFDNVQCWDQTVCKNQTTMSYCELRFPQSPAQLVVSGLVGDLPVPATLAFAQYISSTGVYHTPFTFLVGRRAYATSGPQLALPVAHMPSSTSVPVLDSTSYGGFYVKWTGANSSDTYTPTIFSGRPADYQGFAALFMRMQSAETAGTNIGKVSVTTYAGMQNGPWAQASIFYDSYGTPTVAPLSAQNQWTLVNAGVFPTPGFARSAATDLTQNYQAVSPTFQDGNTTPAALLINWCALVPSDGMLVRGQVQANGNVIFSVFNTWNWYYIDASQGTNGLMPSTGFSPEPTALPNIAHATGGAGMPPANSPNGAMSIIPSGNAFLTLDPTPPTNALSVSGVNQMVGILTESYGLVQQFYCALQYTPQYLDPR